jgi:oxygen-independent coproporphyrinogen-3 oxidase
MKGIVCALINHTHENEIQTVVQLFFPNTRFIFTDEIITDEGYSVTSEWHGGRASGYVYCNNRLAASYSVEPQGYISVKRALMLSLFHALKRTVDAFTPWGALTGIRPSKLVRQWMDEGRTDGEIIRTLLNPFCCQEDKARLAVAVAHAENKISKRIYGTGLYIGIPFCPSRCLYCSFNADGKVDHGLYVQALIRECVEKASRFNGIITSVYVGGGTPTVLPEGYLYKLMENVTRFFPVAETAEFTVEAGRPDSLTPGKLRLLRDFGVNRIAVNPQSLNDNTLERIGRSHTANDFFKAFNMVRTAGFTRINTDIIAGLPGETAADVKKTLQGLMPLGPENITVHTLAVKRASKLNERLNDIPLPHAREVESMLASVRDACEGNGYRPYYLYRQKNMVGLLENVGYSRPGYECLYNVGMMAETQTILGIGAAAVCKRVNGNRIERTFNVKNPQIYIERMLAKDDNPGT